MPRHEAVSGPVLPVLLPVLLVLQLPVLPVLPVLLACIACISACLTTHVIVPVLPVFQGSGIDRVAASAAAGAADSARRSGACTLKTSACLTPTLCECVRRRGGSRREREGEGRGVLLADCDLRL